MRLFSLAVISGSILLASCGGGGETVELSKLQNRNGLYYEVNQEDPYSGPVEEKYENGQVEITGYSEDGLRNGRWTTYYDNGQISSQGEYVDGLKDGEWSYWKENGEAKDGEKYKEGTLLGNEDDVTSGDSDSNNNVETADDHDPNEAVRFGLLTQALKDGALRKMYNGTPYTGKVIDYHDNGVVKLKGQYKEGLRTGKWQYYSEAGNHNNTKQF